MVNVMDYQPCPHCSGFVKGRELFRHLSKSPSFDKDTAVPGTSVISQARRVLSGALYTAGSGLLQQQLDNMVKDHVQIVVQNDAQICAAGYSFGFRK